MARRTFNVVDVTEIFIHWYAGRSISEVAVSLSVDRKTIRRYVTPAVAAGLTPGGQVMAQQEWAALALRWFTQVADTTLRQVTWPDRQASRLHRAPRRARPRRERGVAEAVCDREPARGGAPRRGRHPARQGGPDRLRPPRLLDRPRLGVAQLFANVIPLPTTSTTPASPGPADLKVRWISDRR
jgi:hypothetical protein